MASNIGVLIGRFSRQYSAHLAEQTLLEAGVFSLVQYTSAPSTVVFNQLRAPLIGEGEWGLYVKISEVEKAKEILSNIFDYHNQREKKTVDFSKINAVFITIFVVLLFAVFVIPLLVLIWTQ